MLEAVYKPLSTEANHSFSLRALFYQLINVNAYPVVLPQARLILGQYLQNLPLPDTDLQLDTLLQQIDPACVQGLSIPPPRLTPFQQAAGLEAYTPMACMGACWLQKTSQAIHAHTPVAASLLRVYQAYSLLPLDASWPPADSHAFAYETRLHNWAFERPVVALCLAQYSSAYLAEIVGFTLAAVYTPNDLLAQPEIDTDRQKLQALALTATQVYLQSGTAETLMQRWQGVCQGYQLHHTLEQNFIRHLQTLIPATPRQQMLELLQQKARFACGHHRNHRLGQYKLDEWFSMQPFPATAFLQALEQSSWLNTPKGSHRFKALTDFGGPMFGVFSKSEQAIIQAWQCSLKAQNSTAREFPQHPAANPELESEPATAACTVKPDDSARPVVEAEKPLTKETPIKPIKWNARDWYYHLLQIEQFPHCLPKARQQVDAVIRKARIRCKRKDPFYGACFEFSHTAFQDRLDQIHQRETRAYRPLQGAPKFSKPVYIWGIQQMTPALLVDGCWLQNTHRADNAQTLISQRLFSIFCDEIGDGHSDWNHANIYRKLLNSLTIHLPDFDSSEFARHPGFLTSAFDLPVFLLAISQFPQTMLPEIIGLNLAIEISGLGAGYMQLVDALNYWEIDPYIVSLHLSIDNRSNGHAAIAQDVVSLYLDQIQAISGPAVMQQHWRRIWSGLLSFNIATKRFKYAMGWHYLTHFALRQKSA